jgi:hypothetical protein
MEMQVDAEKELSTCMSPTKTVVVTEIVDNRPYLSATHSPRENLPVTLEIGSPRLI